MVYNIVRLINEYHIIEFIGFHLSECRLFCLLLQLWPFDLHILVIGARTYRAYNGYATTQDKCALVFVFRLLIVV